MDLGPIGRGGIAQGRQAVARNAFDANPFFVLSLVVSIADAFPGIGPICLCHAVDQHAVNIIGVERFLPVLIDEPENVFGAVVDCFGLDEKFFAREALDGVGHPIEGGVGLGAIEVGDALVIGVMDEFNKLVLAHVALGVAAIAAGAKTETAEADAGVAEGDLIRGGPLGKLGGAEQTALSKKQ